MEDGSIVAYGNSEAIIDNDLLHQIYGDNITLDNGAITNSVVFDNWEKEG